MVIVTWCLSCPRPHCFSQTEVQRWSTFKPASETAALTTMECCQETHFSGFHFMVCSPPPPFSPLAPSVSEVWCLRVPHRSSHLFWKSTNTRIMLFVLVNEYYIRYELLQVGLCDSLFDLLAHKLCSWNLKMSRHELTLATF